MSIDKSVIEKAFSNANSIGEILSQLPNNRSICTPHQCDGYVDYKYVMDDVKANIEWPNTDKKPKCKFAECPYRIYDKLYSLSNVIGRKNIFNAMMLMAQSPAWTKYPDDILYITKTELGMTLCESAMTICAICAARLIINNIDPVIYLPHRKVNNANIFVLYEGCKDIYADLVHACGHQCIVIRRGRDVNRGPSG